MFVCLTVSRTMNRRCGRGEVARQVVRSYVHSTGTDNIPSSHLANLPKNIIANFGSHTLANDFYFSLRGHISSVCRV